MKYGKAPSTLGVVDLPWDEYMHFMYLPIKMDNGFIPIRVPDRLKPIVWPLLARIHENECGWPTKYIYVTARRGYATPGNPLNRPGWHTDGFGTPDINYIWTDAYPTLFAEQTFYAISDDHIVSAEQFADQVQYSYSPAPQAITTYPESTLLRLDSGVVHAAPEIPAPGGERGFIKISLSDSKYNLRGNSHNYLFDYDWQMWDRNELRNDPAYAGGDSR